MMATLPTMAAPANLTALLASIGQVGAEDGAGDFCRTLAALPASTTPRGSVALRTPAVKSDVMAAAVPADATEQAGRLADMPIVRKAPAAMDVAAPAVDQPEAPVAMENPVAKTVARREAALPVPPVDAQPGEMETEAAEEKASPVRTQVSQAEALAAKTDSAGETAALPTPPTPIKRVERDAKATRSNSDTADLTQTEGKGQAEGRGEVAAAAMPASVVVGVAEAPVVRQSAHKAAEAPQSRTAPRGEESATAPLIANAVKANGQSRPVLSVVDMDVSVPNARAPEVGPSMTVMLSQPAAPLGAFEVAAPVAAERLLDMGSDDMWIEQLASDILATRSERGDISFRLMPRHLGRLDVAMQQGDEGMSLKLDAQHEATATIVTAAQGRLVEELRQQGVRVAGAEVTHTPTDTGRQPGQGQDRSAQQGSAHLIDTGERADTHSEPQDDKQAAGRGRFA